MGTELLMAVSVMDYRPLLFSERVAGINLDDDPALEFDLCRAACLAMAFDAATLGEWSTNPNGTRWGRAKIRSALVKMRNATGEQQRGGFNQSHMDDFLRGIRAPQDVWVKFNVPMARIKEALGNGFVVLLAGDVAGTPVKSGMRKYVRPGVGHEILLTAINKDGTRIAYIDPMVPHGTAKYQRWAPAREVAGFGSRFKTGKNYIAGKVKRGKYTRAQQVARDRAAVIKDMQERLLSLAAEWEKQQAELIVSDGVIENLKHEISVLEIALAECETTPDPSDDALELCNADLSLLIDKIDKIREIVVE
jgi:hypothetical protein